MAPAPLATADRSAETAFHMGELSSPPTTLTRGRAYGASMSSPRSGSSGANRRARRAAPLAMATAAMLTLSLDRASPEGVSVVSVAEGVSPVPTPTLSGMGIGVTVPSSPSGVAATNLRLSAAAFSFSSRRSASSSSGRPGSGVGSSTPHRSSFRNHSATEGNTCGGRFETRAASRSGRTEPPACFSALSALAKATHSSARVVSGWSCP